MLTSKQSKFIEAYKTTGDIKSAVVQAGYSPKNANSIAVEANRLLKNPKISHEIANWKFKKASEITKDDYIDVAMQSFKSLDVTEPNSPRFYDIAGKALGYLGNGNDANHSINNTQINIVVNGNEKQLDLWTMSRSLLGQ